MYSTGNKTVVQNLDSPFDTTDDLFCSGSANSSQQGDDNNLILPSIETDDTTSVTTLEQNNDDGIDAVSIEKDSETDTEVEFTKNWPGIDFDQSDSEYIDDTHLRRDNITAVTVTPRKSAGEVEIAFEIVPGQNKIGDWSSDENSGDEATSHLCYLAGQDECALCGKPGSLPVKHDVPGHSVVLDEANESVEGGESSQSQASVQCEAPWVPWYEPPGVRNRMLIKEAWLNAGSSRFISRNFYLPAGFLRGADPDATLAVGLTASDFDNDPEIGAGFGPISKIHLPGNIEVDELVLPGKENPIQDSILAAFVRETSPLGSVFEVESGDDEPCTIGSPDKHAFYTAEEYRMIREQLYSRLPYLKDHTKCTNCGRDPRPHTVVVCAQCNKAAYCSKYCQLWDWPIHLLMCDRSADLSSDVVKKLITSMATYWQGAMTEISKALKNGTRFEECTGGENSTKQDEQQRSHGAAVPPASPSSMLWSRALSLHLAKGGRFKVDLFDD